MSRRKGTAKPEPGKARGGAAQLTVDKARAMEDDFEDDLTDLGPVPAWVKGSFAIRHTQEQIAEFKEMKNAEYWRKKKVKEEEREVGAGDDSSSGEQLEDGESDNETAASSVTTIALLSGSSSVHEDERKAVRVGSNHEQRKPEGIMRKRNYMGTFRYLVRWEGLPDSESTWEAEDELRRVDCDGLLEKFQKDWVPSRNQQKYAKAKQKRDGTADAVADEARASQSSSSNEDGVLDHEVSLALVSTSRQTDFFRAKQTEELETLTGDNFSAKDHVADEASSKKPGTFAASEDKVSSFEPTSLISKVKKAYRLKSHFGVTFKSKKYVDMDMDDFRALIRDRAQGLEVIQEISQYLEQLKASAIKLAGEVEDRRNIVETSEIASVFYEEMRGEVEIANTAYKNCTTRVMDVHKKADEIIKSFDDMGGSDGISSIPSFDAPSPSPDEGEFEVPQSDKCCGIYFSESNMEVVQPNEVPIDPMSAVNTVTRPNANSSSPASTGRNSHPPSVNPPGVSPTEPNRINPCKEMESLQQKLRQAGPKGWMEETYASMSMSMALPNFMQQFQQKPSVPIMSSGYGVQMQQPPPQQPYANMSNIGYETYQLQSDQHQHATPPDISSIPLPPGPNPPQPPPPLPQEAPPLQQSIPYATSQLPPPPGNPFETEYDPMYSYNSTFSKPTGYDPASNPYNNSQTPSPVDISIPPPSRYHPYNNHSPRGQQRRLSGPPHSTRGTRSNILANSYHVKNNSSLQKGSRPEIPPLMLLPIELSPMERFMETRVGQTLRKSRRKGSSSNRSPESAVNKVSADWSALMGAPSQSNCMQSQNPFYNTNITNNTFNSFDDDQGQGKQKGPNGNEIEPAKAKGPNIWEIANNIFDPTPSPLQHNNRGTYINPRGGGVRDVNRRKTNARGLSRGVGGSRDGAQNSRGLWRGTRGVGGMSKTGGPSHARGRGRF